MIPDSNSAFRFSDPRQARVHERLERLVGPGPAAFFRDACRLMENQPGLETVTHLVGHCLREVESALRDVLKPISNPKLGSPDEGHKTEIRAALIALEIPETADVAKAWLKLPGRSNEYALHKRVHRDSLEAPRRLDPDFRSFWEAMVGILDLVLDRLEARSVEVYQLLDRLLKIEAPSKQDMEKLRQQVPNNRFTYGYFFQRLASPGWLQPLAENGFFTDPPEPFVDAEKGTKFPWWPQSGYLARMAQLDPATVRGIIQRISDTRNITVNDDFLDAAIAMPHAVSVQLVPKVLMWIDSGLRLPKKVGPLFRKLSEGGELDAALRLAAKLLAIRPDPRAAESQDETIRAFLRPRTLLDTWDLKQVLFEDVPALVRASEQRALELLCDLLAEAVRLSQPNRGEPEWEDYSYSTKPALDPECLNDDELDDVLIAAVRDASIQIVASGRATLREIVECLEKRKWRIFRRLALYVLREHPQMDPALVAERLTDPQWIRDHTQKREYKLLAEQCFPILTSAEQEKLLAAIDKGLDRTVFRQELQQEEVDRYSKQWQLDQLAPVKAHLSHEWFRRFDALVAEVGSPDNYKEIPQMQAGFFEPTSPITEADLGQMNVPELKEYLRSWRPTDGIFNPSMEGLGGKLSKVVAADPKRFAQEAPLFCGLDPTYIRHVLRPFAEAVKQGEVIDWGPVLELCQWVADQPKTIPGRQARHFESDPDWGYARRAICDLLSAGFQKDSIPPELRMGTWHIPERLVEDTDPTPEEEAGHPEPSWASDLLVRSGIRGEAFCAIMQYALWLRRHTATVKGAVAPVNFEDMPEVRTVLERHLDIQHDPSPNVRAQYGRWLPWLYNLAPQWTERQLRAIFPREQGLEAFRKAAWLGYVSFKPYGPVFQVLRHEYEHAIESISRDGEDNRADRDEHLASHLVVMYCRGLIDLKENGNLLERFYQRAPGKLRGFVLDHVGRSLKETEGPADEKIMERLKTLWENRLSEAQSRGLSQDVIDELSWFGTWFVCERFSDEWCLDQLRASLRVVGTAQPVHSVVERLAKMSQAKPVEAVECLAAIAEHARDDWWIFGWRDHARDILSDALASQDAIAAKAAVELINRLAARGYHEFRSLLGPPS